jgi:origin recognition complex subunit 1
VLDVMRSLRRRSEAGDLPQFQFVEINGLRLPGPQFAYSCLYEALTGERLGPAAAAAALEEVFAGSGKGARRGSAISRRPIVVLLDEMDLLVTRTQTVLYNMFDWPARRGSRLSIIGIANTMDLPERLHPRIGSRLAGRRVVFQPYQRDQLETIVRSRLEGCSAFDANALTLVARKVANCSGDVRRCLELCRRAAELVQEQEAGAAGTSGQAASGRVTVRPQPAGA